MSSLSPIPLITTLSPSIIRILGCNPSTMTLQGTNTYLIGNSKYRYLIDTGSGNNKYIELLDNIINENKYILKGIILTHRHYDHTGGIDHIIKRYGKIPIYKYRDKKYNENYEYVDMYENQEFKIDNDCTLKIIHTPGHTDDSISILYIEENSIFTGDTILGYGTTVFQNLYLYMKSLSILKLRNPSILYPGHGPIIMDSISHIDGYINHRLKREVEIYNSLLNSPKTALEIVKDIYEIPESLYNAAAGNVLLHLEKLVVDSKVICLDDEILKSEKPDSEEINLNYLLKFKDVIWQSNISKL